MKKFIMHPIVQISFFAIILLGIGFAYPWVVSSILSDKSADQSLIDESINLMTSILSALIGFVLVYILWPQVQKKSDEKRSKTILNGRFYELRRKAQKSLDLLNKEFKENEFDASEERDREIIRTKNLMADEFDKLSSAIIETTFLVKPELKNSILLLVSDRIEPDIDYLKSLTDVRGSGTPIREKLQDIISATFEAIHLLSNGQGK